jgi:hypothetical protein
LEQERISQSYVERQLEDGNWPSAAPNELTNKQ